MFTVATPATKNTQYYELVTTKFRPFLASCEKQLERNNSRFMAGNRVTMADCVMFSVTHNMFLNTQFEAHAIFLAEFQNYPRLNTYAQTLEHEFANFINSRPQQGF